MSPHHACMLISNFKSYIASVEWKIVEIKKSSIIHSNSIIAQLQVSTCSFLYFLLGWIAERGFLPKHEYTGLKNSVTHGTRVIVSEKRFSFFHNYNSMIALLRSYLVLFLLFGCYLKQDVYPQLSYATSNCSC